MIKLEHDSRNGRLFNIKEWSHSGGGYTITSMTERSLSISSFVNVQTRNYIFT